MPRGPEPSSFLPLTHLVYHLLLALAEEPGHAYALVQRIRDNSGGSIDPGTGSFYSIIRQTVDNALITDAPGNTGEDARRRVYALTPLGRRVLEAEAARLEAQLAATRRSLGFAGRRPR